MLYCFTSFKVRKLYSILNMNQAIMLFFFVNNPLQSNFTQLTSSRSMKNRKNKSNLKLSVEINVQTSKNGKPNQTENKSNFKKPKQKQIGITLWRVLLSELNIGERLEREKIDKDQDEEELNEWSDNVELLLTYIKLPIEVENFMLFGFLYSTVVFLKWLIIIPSRWVIHTILCIIKLVFSKKRDNKSTLLMYKNDTLSMSGILITLVLIRNLDTSRIYHNIRSGTAIKLYFMMQVLEIADRLLSSSGQDILRVLYKFNKISTNNKISFIKISQFLILYVTAVIYLWFHSYVLVYQVMALNVAINSYSNALLTLILSNQFSELKSAVFKKTEREGLFQVSCSDLNERFLLLIMLGIISSRNLLQILLNTSSINGLFNNIKPNSWYAQFTNWKTFDDWLGLLIGPPILVIGSEILVDWIKHAYIIRFNRIKPSVYNKFTRILASDFVKSFTSDNFSKSINHINDHPNLLTKRTGFPISTVLIIFCKLTVFPYLQFHISNIYNNTQYGGKFMGTLFILLILSILVSILVFIRLLLSIALLQWSKKVLESSSNTTTLNDYIPGDPNVNPSSISDIRDSFYDKNEKIPPSLEDLRIEKTFKNKDDKLNNVVRFEMADKRIW